MSAYKGSLQTTTQGRGTTTPKAPSTSSSSSTPANGGGGSGNSQRLSPLPSEPVPATPSLGLQDGTYTNSKGEVVTVAQGGTGQPITRTTSGQSVKQVTSDIYVSNGGGLFYAKTTPRSVTQTASVTQPLASSPSAAAGTQSPTSQYVVTNPDTGKQVDLAQASNAHQAMLLAGYHSPQNKGTLVLNREKRFFTLKGEGYLSPWYIPGSGLEEKGRITVFEKTVTAQNQTEARLAGLPSTGTYTMLTDTRTYEPRTSSLTSWNKAAGAKIEQASVNRKVSVQSVSEGIEGLGRQVRESNQALATKYEVEQVKNPSIAQRFTLGGKAVVHNTAQFAALSGSFVETIGADIRGRPVELAGTAAGGVALKAADSALVAARSSQLLSGSGKLATAARATITGTRVTTGVALVGGFAGSTGYEAIQTRGDPAALGKLAATTTEDLAAFGTGARLLKTNKLPSTSGALGEVMVRERTVNAFETTSPTLANPLKPRTTITTTYAEEFTGRLKPTDKPIRTTVRSYPSGTLTKVQTAGTYKIVTTQAPQSTTATARVYEAGQLLQIETIKVAPTTSRPIVQELGSKTNTVSRQLAPNIIAQASATRSQALVTTTYGDKPYTGLSTTRGALSALSIAGDARVRTFGRIVQNDGRGGKIKRSQTGATQRVMSRLTLADETSATRNEYAVSRGAFTKDFERVQTSEPTLVLDARSQKVERTVAGLTAKRAVGSVVQGVTITETHLAPTPRATPTPIVKAAIKDVKPLLNAGLRTATKQPRTIYSAGQTTGTLISETEATTLARLSIKKLAAPSAKPSSVPMLNEQTTPFKAVPLTTGTTKEPTTTQTSNTQILSTTKEAGAARTNTPRTITKDQTRTITKPNEDVSVARTPASKAATQLKTGSATRNTTKQLPALGVQPITTTVPKQLTKTEPQVKVELLRATKIRGEQISRGRNNSNILPTKLNPPSRSSDKLGGGFNVFVKRKGKFKRVNAEPLPAMAALNLGKERTNKTIAASFKVQSTTGQPIDIMSSLASLGRTYRQGKKDKQSFVQRAPFRLSTSGEKQDIRAAQRSKLGRLHL